MALKSAFLVLVVEIIVSVVQGLSSCFQNFNFFRESGISLKMSSGLGDLKPLLGVTSSIFSISLLSTILWCSTSKNDCKDLFAILRSGARGKGLTVGLTGVDSMIPNDLMNTFPPYIAIESLDMLLIGQVLSHDLIT